MAGLVIRMLDFYKGKRVFVTGNTGFKGSWLSTMLLMAGADVTGYALPPTEPSLFRIIGLEQRMRSVQGDIRDFDALRCAFEAAKPEIVFHLAAQPIVRESYRDPVGTYSTNVMGTVHILECIRRSNCVRSFLNVTTDKVYANRQWSWGYRETDRLNGFDPYSNSKSCSELVTDGYRNSFFSSGPVAVSTARAGNVIGGGDFAEDRIIPDCIRAIQKNAVIQLRNPNAVRPYQHVLDPLAAYLLIVQRQYEDKTLSGCFNIGPDASDCISTKALADLFCDAWGACARWEQVSNNGPHEDVVLKLDCSKIRSELGWSPRWNVDRAVAETVSWTKAWLSGQEMSAFMEQQIHYFSAGDDGQGEDLWKK